MAHTQTDWETIMTKCEKCGHWSTMEVSCLVEPKDIDVKVRIRDPVVPTKGAYS